MPLPDARRAEIIANTGPWLNALPAYLDKLPNCLAIYAWDKRPMRARNATVMSAGKDLYPLAQRETDQLVDLNSARNLVVKYRQTIAGVTYLMRKEHSMFTFDLDNAATKLAEKQFDAYSAAEKSAMQSKYDAINARILNDFAGKTYIEKSMSGNGWHIIGYSARPIQRMNFDLCGSIFTHSQFIHLTGDLAPGSQNDIYDCGDIAAALIAEYSAAGELHPVKADADHLSPDMLDLAYTVVHSHGRVESQSFEEFAARLQRVNKASYSFLTQGIMCSEGHSDSMMRLIGDADKIESNPSRMFEWIMGSRALIGHEFSPDRQQNRVRKWHRNFFPELARRRPKNDALLAARAAERGMTHDAEGAAEIGAQLDAIRAREGRIDGLGARPASGAALEAYLAGLDELGRLAYDMAMAADPSHVPHDVYGRPIGGDGPAPAPVADDYAFTAAPSGRFSPSVQKLADQIEAVIGSKLDMEYAPGITGRIQWQMNEMQCNPNMVYTPTAGHALIDSCIGGMCWISDEYQSTNYEVNVVGTTHDGKSTATNLIADIHGHAKLTKYAQENNPRKYQPLHQKLFSKHFTTRFIRQDAISGQYLWEAVIKTHPNSVVIVDDKRQSDFGNKSIEADKQALLRQLFIGRAYAGVSPTGSIAGLKRGGIQNVFASSVCVYTNTTPSSITSASSAMDDENGNANRGIMIFNNKPSAPDLEFEPEEVRLFLEKQELLFIQSISLAASALDAVRNQIMYPEDGPVKDGNPVPQEMSYEQLHDFIESMPIAQPSPEALAMRKAIRRIIMGATNEAQTPGSGRPAHHARITRQTRLIEARAARYAFAEWHHKAIEAIGWYTHGYVEGHDRICQPGDGLLFSYDATGEPKWVGGGEYPVTEEHYKAAIKYFMYHACVVLTAQDRNEIYVTMDAREAVIMRCIRKIWDMHRAKPGDPVALSELSKMAQDMVPFRGDRYGSAKAFDDAYQTLKKQMVIKEVVDVIPVGKKRAVPSVMCDLSASHWNNILDPKGVA